MVKVEENKKQSKQLRQKLIENLKQICTTHSYSELYISLFIALVAKDAKNISFSMGTVEFTTKEGKKFYMNRETGKFLKPMESRDLELAKIREINRSKNGLSK